MSCCNKVFLEFHNQPHLPAFNVTNKATEFRDMTGIDVLHTFPLGVTTDVLQALESFYPVKMQKFFCETKQRKELGYQPGGKFRSVTSD